MSDTSVSSRSVVSAIVAKDLRTFGRDRFWLFMTALALVWFVALYYLLPNTVDENVRVGVHWTGTDAALEVLSSSESGIEWVRYASRDELLAALGVTPPDDEGADSVWDRIKAWIDRDEPARTPEPIGIGIDFPDDFLVKVHLTIPTGVVLYVAPDTPEDVRDALTVLIREGAYALTGQALPIAPPEAETVVLGTDRAGEQVPLRDKVKPLYAFMMLLMETLALGALTAEEVSSRTVTAVLATPARAVDFLVAKALVGTALAFSEAALLMLLVRAFGDRPLMLAVALLLGAVLVTGVALILGASGRDFISLIFFSLLFLIPLAIPAIAELFPGSASPWVKILPTYGLVQAIVGATVYDVSWSDAAPHLASLALWCVAALVVGLVVLRRKVATL